MPLAVFTCLSNVQFPDFVQYCFLKELEDKLSD